MNAKRRSTKLRRIAAKLRREAIDRPPGPRPARGWTVHSRKTGELVGVVDAVLADHRVRWHSVRFGTVVKSGGRFEDAPPGVYRPPVPDSGGGPGDGPRRRAGS